MLEIRFLGRYQVLLDSKSIEIPSRPAQSLFAYLVLNPGTDYRREQLAGLFWPDMSESKARNNLRQSLWRIRKVFGTPQEKDELILTNSYTIRFNTQSEYRIDVEELKRELPEVWSVEQLMATLSLYQGELLPGFYEDWVVLAREHIQAAFERKMQRLLERLIERERWHDVLEWGERWIALGHVPEIAFRALIIAHGKLGNTSSMAMVYQRCAEVLREELGVEPSEDTRITFEKLSAGERLSELHPRMPKGKPDILPEQVVASSPSNQSSFIMTTSNSTQTEPLEIISHACPKCRNLGFVSKINVLGLRVIHCLGCGHLELVFNPRYVRQPAIIVNHRTRLGWRFWLLWVLSTAIGFALGAGESGVAVAKINSLGALTWSLFLVGIGPGVTQWLVLRRRIPRAGWWILATAGGLVLVIGIIAVVSMLAFGSILEQNRINMPDSIPVAILMFEVLLLGAGIGALQWLILRQHFPQAYWWIAVSAIGWSVGLITGLRVAVRLLNLAILNFVMFREVMNFESIVPFYGWPAALSGFVAGAAIGAITGIALTRFLRQAPPS